MLRETVRTSTCSAFVGRGPEVCLVSVVIPALNEEEGLGAAVSNVLEAAKAAGNVPVDIIIVDDGSTDGTAAVAARLQSENPGLQVVRHPKNLGFGAAFLSGVKAARYDRVTIFPGDNVVSKATLRNLIRYADSADLVCAYTVNTEYRTWLRNFLSALFTFIYTTTFNIQVRYIHATPVYHVPRLRAMNLRCQRYSFPSEPTIKFLRSGCTFLEIPGYHTNYGEKKSSALRLGNLFEVVAKYILLIYEVYIAERARYSFVPRRVILDDSRLL